MDIIDFQKVHIEQAKKLAIINYNEERTKIPVLPEHYQFPDLEDFARNGLGVAAFEGDQMIGFLGCYRPWDHAFDSLAKGTFTPIHAHGAIKKERERIYQRMYQVAANKWVKQKIAYHAIALYAHDKEAIHAFYNYGFGLRCLDAIRPMECLETVTERKFTYQELAVEERGQILELRKCLAMHFRESPCFMSYSEQEFQESEARRDESELRVFVAKDGDRPIAFIQIRDKAETFVTEVSDMMNLCGAYCLPEYRGKNIVQNLLNNMISQLKKENYHRLGVDYESFNPTASMFWPKSFTAYTNSLV